ncbi:MAG: hypothetical protein IPM46_03375 [Flavobacteriales bacterium]|nr:hypothetical protein [Flavobacteriales bacterium]
MNEPKTKIVATIGPASNSREVLRDMILSGMDVCRLNFSHGAYDFYAELIVTIRALNEELGTTVAILADLQGPKLRVGTMENGPIELKDGDLLTITTEPVGTCQAWSRQLQAVHQDVKARPVSVDDGKLASKCPGTDGAEDYAE